MQTRGLHTKHIFATEWTEELSSSETLSQGKALRQELLSGGKVQELPLSGKTCYMYHLLKFWVWASFINYTGIFPQLENDYNVPSLPSSDDGQNIQSWMKGLSICTLKTWEIPMCTYGAFRRYPLLPRSIFHKKWWIPFPTQKQNSKIRGKKILILIMIIMLSARYPLTGPLALLSRCFLYP